MSNKKDFYSIEYYSTILGVLEDVQYKEWSVSRWNPSENSLGKHDAPFMYSLNVSDVFFWGSADSENLLPEDIDLWVQAHKDCPSLGDILFVSRKRETRPQGAFFTYIPKEQWKHFEETGPVREKAIGNPCNPGEYRPENQVSTVPNIVFRDTYPLADASQLFTILEDYSGFSWLYDLTMPRISDDGNVCLEVWNDDDIVDGKRTWCVVEKFTVEEYKKMKSHKNWEEDTVWKNYGKLRQTFLS